MKPHTEDIQEFIAEAVRKAKIEALNLAIKIQSDTYSWGTFRSAIQWHIDKLEKK